MVSEERPLVSRVPNLGVQTLLCELDVIFHLANPVSTPLIDRLSSHNYCTLEKILGPGNVIEGWSGSCRVCGYRPSVRRYCSGMDGVSNQWQLPYPRPEEWLEPAHLCQS